MTPLTVGRQNNACINLGLHNRRLTRAKMWKRGVHARPN
jgi:hypothetical protein